MDYLLDEFFKQERWEQAIDTAIDKHISKTDLRQLCTAEVRAYLYRAIEDDRYRIAPPHTAQIPKSEPGEFRTVYINENLDRVVLSILNDMLFELCPEMIHPACKSYQKGIGCGKIVQRIVTVMEENPNPVIGFKADLSKYFDSVPIEFIDKAFDAIENKFGKSKIIEVARNYYHQDLYFDENGELKEKYQSLKQGCALASFLADTLLYQMDEALSQVPGYYVRYSDDTLYIGEHIDEAERILKTHLWCMALRINPKKFEYLTHDKWFKFLGFNIRGNQITLSKERVKTFQKEIEKRTIRAPHTRMARAVNQVNNYLYKGEYSWATSVLGVINVHKDIDTLNRFVMDCIRACETQKTKIGGLGVITNAEDFTILRGTGKNVTANRTKTAKVIDGYMTLECMRNNLLTCRPLYETIVRQL